MERPGSPSAWSEVFLAPRGDTWVAQIKSRTLQRACTLASLRSLHLLLLQAQLLQFPDQFRKNSKKKKKTNKQTKNSNFYQPLHDPRDSVQRSFAVERHPCDGHQWSTRKSYGSQEEPVLGRRGQILRWESTEEKQPQLAYHLSFLKT